jgi:hypothetical protein
MSGYLLSVLVGMVTVEPGCHLGVDMFVAGLSGVAREFSRKNR